MPDDQTIAPPPQNPPDTGGGQSPNDPRKNLYDYLSKNQLYTNSYDDFNRKYNNPQSIDALYDYVNKAQLYTNSRDDFYNKYFADLPNKTADAHAFIQSQINGPQVTKAIDKITGDRFYNQQYQKQSGIDPNMSFEDAMKVPFQGVSQGGQQSDMTKNVNPLPLRLKDQAQSDRQAHLQEIQNNPVLLRQTLAEAKRQNMLREKVIDPEFNKNLDAAMYQIDASQRPHSDAVVNYNLGQIKAGNYTYDINKQQITQPTGFVDQVFRAMKKHSDDMDDYDFYTTASDQQKIDKLNKERQDKNPDMPTFPESGDLASIGNNIGSLAVAGGKGSLPSKILAAIPTPQTKALSIFGNIIGSAWAASDFHHSAYVNQLKSTYNEEMSKPNADPEIALAKAEDNATFSGRAAAVQGALMSYAGAKLGKDIKFTGSTMGQRLNQYLEAVGTKVAPEVLGQSSIAGVTKAVENAHQGKPIGDNVVDNVLAAALYTGAHGLLKAPGVLWTPEGRKAAIDALANSPEQMQNAAIGTLVGHGLMDAQDAIDHKNELNATKAANDNKVDVHSPLTPEAEQVLKDVDNGGVPAFMTNNLRKIAKDNGIDVEVESFSEKGERNKTKELSPNEVIEQLRQKQASVKPPEFFKEEPKTAEHEMVHSQEEQAQPQEQAGGEIKMPQHPIQISYDNDLGTIHYGDNLGEKQTKTRDAQVADDIVNNRPIGKTGDRFSDFLGRVVPAWKNVMDNKSDNTVVSTSSSSIKAYNVAKSMGFPDITELVKDNELTDKGKEFAQKFAEKEPAGLGAIQTEKTEDGRNIHILRHGETQASVDKLYRPDNTKLTDNGVQQAQDAGKELLEKTGGNIPEIITPNETARTLQTTNEVHNILRPKTQDNAIRQQGPSGVLQHPQEGAGSQGGERGRVEQSIKGQETTPESKGEGQKKPRIAGIAQRVQEELGLRPYEAGEGWTKEESLAFGNAALDHGVDPYKTATDKNYADLEFDERAAVAQAHTIRLTKDMYDAGDKFGEDSRQYKDAEKDLKDYQEITGPLRARWSRAGVSQQGEMDIDSGSFTATKKSIEEKTGARLNVEEQSKVKELTGKIADLNKEKDDLKNKLDEAINKNVGGKEKATYTEKAKAVADAFRKLKTRPFTFKDENGNDIEVTKMGPGWNDIVELGAKAIEKTGEIADGIAAVIDKVKDADWYKGLSDKDKAEFSRQLESHYQENAPEIALTPEEKNVLRLEKRLEDLRQGIVKQAEPKREPSQREKDLQDEIFEAKKNLGLVPSKPLPVKPESELTPAEKNINRLQKQLDDIQSGNVKQAGPKRELTQEEKDIQEQIFEAKKNLGLIKTKPVKEETPNVGQKLGKRGDYDELVTRFGGKKDTKFTPEDSKDMLAYAKENYINDNPKFGVADIVNKVAMDLGLTPEQVRKALGQTPETKRMVDQMYKNQYEANKAKQTIQNWVNKNKGENPASKLLDMVASPFRGLATLGHSTALLGTHALPNLFDIGLTKKFLTLAGKQFKIVYGNGANYEKAKTDLRTDPLFTTALRAKVGVDPDTIYDDWQLATSFLKKLKVQGNKGFLILKMIRMEAFRYEYNKLSNIEKADPETVERIGQIANHWTGTAGIKPSTTANAFIFAPNLIVSKFARLTTDPANALITKGKIMMGQKVSLADNAAANIILKKTGRIAAGYLTALIANQAMLKITGSNSSVNFTHPTRSDWLKFKTGETVGDKAVDLSGGLDKTLGFLTQLAILPFEGKGDYQKDYYGAKTAKEAAQNTLMGYASGTLSPFGSTVYEGLTHRDFRGNVVPWSSDTPSKGKEKLNYWQYAREKFPIPVADAFQTVHDEMKNSGVPEATAKQVLGGVVEAAIASMGIKIGNTPKQQTDKTAVRQSLPLNTQ